jgi:Fe-S-cluster containining protein
VYLTPRERCSVYDARPFVCRIYGAIKNLSCPHGCVPDRWMSPHDTARLFARLTKIGAWQLTTPEGLVAYDDADGTIAAITGGAAHMPAAVVEALAEHVRGLRALHGGHVLAATPGPTNRMVDIDDVSHARAIVKAHTPENAEKG